MTITGRSRSGEFCGVDQSRVCVAQTGDHDSRAEVGWLEVIRGHFGLGEGSGRDVGGSRDPCEINDADGAWGILIHWQLNIERSSRRKRSGGGGAQRDLSSRVNGQNRGACRDVGTINFHAGYDSGGADDWNDSRSGACCAHRHGESLLFTLVGHDDLGAIWRKLNAVRMKANIEHFKLLSSACCGWLEVKEGHFARRAVIEHRDERYDTEPTALRIKRNRTGREDISRSAEHIVVGNGGALGQRAVSVDGVDLDTKSSSGRGSDGARQSAGGGGIVDDLGVLR